MGEIRPAGQIIKACLFGALCVASWSSQAAPESAAQADVIQPHISASTLHDSNIFRLSKSSNPQTTLGTSEKSDTVNRLEAGLDVNLPISRQRLLLGASIGRNWYDRFSFLNNTDKRANGTLLWEIGNQWSGDLGTTYEETIASFGDLQTRVRDEITRKRNFVNAAYLFHPSWQLHGGVETYDLDRSRLPDRNREETLSKLGLRYISRADNYIDLEARYTDADFPNRTTSGSLSGTVGPGEEFLLTVTPIDNAFDQTELRGEVDWRYSKSHVNARLGYLKRDHEQFPARDFSGGVARLTYDWNITGKTLLNFAAWREVRSTEDLLSSYVVSKGFSFTPTWDATSKISLRLRLAREEVDFRGDPGVAAGVSTLREDTVRTATLSLNYAPFDNTQFILGYERQKRESTRNLADYTYDNVNASVRVDF
ncbi:MAG: XrtB/PEP-CTERM-associated polysaccharide biosynthesis outer membrane protein EpsL [Pseudomonadota bacterium]